MSLFSSLPNMPGNDDPSTLQYTVDMLIGAYDSWLAATVRVDQKGQALVSQLLRLLMSCEKPTFLSLVSTCFVLDVIDFVSSLLFWFCHLTLITLSAASWHQQLCACPAPVM